jgi:hypothetical protein
MEVKTGLTGTSRPTGMSGNIAQDMKQAALPDCHALIVALEKLVAKKRDILLATQAQLRSGKIKLSGFPPHKNGHISDAENAAIEAILDDMRAELAGIQRRLEKTRLVVLAMKH